MKRVLGLAAATSVLLLLSACRTGNVGMNNRNNSIFNDTNQGTTIGMNNNNYSTGNGTANIGRTSGINITNNFKGNLKDGGYTSFGNPHDNVNERAVVSIRNGRIADIDLSTVSAQEANNSGTRTSMGTGSSTKADYDKSNLTGVNTGNSSGTNVGYSTGSGYGYENSNSTNPGYGGMTNNTASGYGTGTANGTNTGYINGSSNSIASGYSANPGFGTDTGYGLGSGYDTGYGTNSEYRVGTGPINTAKDGTIAGQVTGTRTSAQINTNANDTINITKNNLITAMLQAQSDSATINNIDKNMVTSVANWKLAVRRALDQASK